MSRINFEVLICFDIVGCLTIHFWNCFKDAIKHVYINFVDKVCRIFAHITAGKDASTLYDLIIKVKMIESL